ncbi:MAG: hypothetical protein WD851_17825, partial [Pirellulales bacterium]
QYDNTRITIVDADGQEYFNGLLGYINPANGDRLQCATYEIPGTSTHVSNITDCRVTGNILTIPSGAQYSNGATIRVGGSFFYDNGSLLRADDFTWFHPNGTTLKSGSTYTWLNGTTLRSTTANNYPNGSALKTGASIFYENGATFLNATAAFYANGSNLKTAGGTLSYEDGAQFFEGEEFFYPSGQALINSSGDPFSESGSSATVPFEQLVPMSGGDVYVALGLDEIARYSVLPRGTLANFSYGGSVDYSGPDPLVGDYNGDGVVGAADYTIWRDTLGSTTDLRANGDDSNSVIDAADYGVWTANFGETLGAGASVEERGASAVDAAFAQYDGPRFSSNRARTGISSQLPTEPDDDSLLLLATNFVESDRDEDDDTSMIVYDEEDVAENDNDLEGALISSGLSILN